MNDLLTGEQMLFTELQNFTGFLSYCILKFGKFVGFLIKKDAKIEFSDVLGIFELPLYLQSKLAEIWNIAYTHKVKNPEHYFFEKYCKFLILCQFCIKKCQKNTKNCQSPICFGAKNLIMTIFRCYTTSCKQCISMKSRLYGVVYIAA